MKVFITCSLVAAFFCIRPASGQDDPVKKGMDAITTDAIKAQTGFLASDWTEGREAGEKGEFLAGDYIASMLQLYGIKPWGDYVRRGSQPGYTERTFFQNFTILKSLPGDDPVMSIKTTGPSANVSKELIWNTDFILRNISKSLQTEAPVVFAGYGFINSRIGYNDFEKKDIRGKFILRIAGAPPEAVNKLTSGEISASLAESESFARSQGAAGIIEFSYRRLTVGPAEPREFNDLSPAEGRPVTGRPRARFSLPGAEPGGDFIVAEVSARAGIEMLRALGYTTDAFVKSGDLKDLYLPGKGGEVKVVISQSLKTTQVSVRNILGVIEGEKSDEIIVVGAHYDHMGMGNGYIWNGADDNASGTAGVLMLAKAAASAGKKPEKTIVFALWTAEEEGLLGSRYFTRYPTVPLSHFKLNMNFDMISRYINDKEIQKVTMTYTSSYPNFRDITVKNIAEHQIALDVDYQPSDDPPGGTDHRSFVEVKVPVIRFKPGHREEYHTPYDELSTLDWDIMEKIIRISFADLWNLANTEW